MVSYLGGGNREKIQEEGCDVALKNRLFIKLTKVFDVAMHDTCTVSSDGTVAVMALVSK